MLTPFHGGRAFRRDWNGGPRPEAAEIKHMITAVFFVLLCFLF